MKLADGTDAGRQDNLVQESAKPIWQSGSRRDRAIVLGVCGVPIGAILYTHGYLALVWFLETFLAPPLYPGEKYGQFGFLLILLGFFGAVYGATFALIPYTGCIFWLPAFGIVTVAMHSVELIDLPLLHVWSFAQTILVALVLCLGVAADYSFFKEIEPSLE